MTKLVNVETGEIVSESNLVHVDFARDLETASDPALAVVAALESAKTWLAMAIAEGKGDHIAEWKSKAHGILAYVRQRELGKEAELAGSEIIRRAERAIGIVIDQGQEKGVITSKGGDRRSEGFKATDDDFESPLAFVAGPRERCDVKILADHSDEEFESAVDAARSEGNLSRANVLRKLGRDYSAQARANRASGESDKPRDKESPNYKKRHLKADRMVAETVTTLDGVCSVLNMTKVHELNHEMVEEWATSLTKSVNRISRFIKEMTRVAS